MLRLFLIFCNGIEKNYRINSGITYNTAFVTVKVGTVAKEQNVHFKTKLIKSSVELSLKKINKITTMTKIVSGYVFQFVLLGFRNRLGIETIQIIPVQFIKFVKFDVLKLLNITHNINHFQFGRQMQKKV